MLVEPNTPVQPHRPFPTNPSESIEAVIRVRGISKRYHIYDRPQDRLKEMLFTRFGKRYGRDFWALRDISFDVNKGEVVGIIGRNGSGKSTLLQIITGTLAPTEGEVQVKGRIAALLELGSGFKPEFTGRENVLLNGAILGMSQKEMEERFDTIAAFADIGSYIDQPVKTYSSGMMVRLAFAVQASVEPDILIVDEALAVGDIFFRQKCYRRLEDLRARGVSILLVSHSMPDIEQLCARAVLLDHGRIQVQGPAPEVVKRYYLIEQHLQLADQVSTPAPIPHVPITTHPQHHELIWPLPSAMLNISQITQVSNGWARCTAVALCNNAGLPCYVFAQGEIASFFYEFELLEDIDVPIGGVVIQNDKGVIAHGKNTLQYGTDVPVQLQKGSRIRFQQNIALELALGEYTFEVGLAALNHYVYDNLALYTNQDLHNKTIRICHLSAIAKFAVVLRRDGQPIGLLHHGIANLPGSCQSSMVRPTHNAHYGHEQND